MFQYPSKTTCLSRVNVRFPFILEIHRFYELYNRNVID
jgi:hypothetical protein